MLTFTFEIIRMNEHETFGKFHAQLMNKVNSSFNFGEPILGERFNIKSYY